MPRDRFAFTIRFNDNRPGGPGFEVDAADPAKGNHLFLVDHAPISVESALALAKAADLAAAGHAPGTELDGSGIARTGLIEMAVRRQIDEYREQLRSQVTAAEQAARSLDAKRAALADYDAQIAKRENCTHPNCEQHGKSSVTGVRCDGTIPGGC